jgi:APA family basic amino acid/polyamine antiporter
LFISSGVPVGYEHPLFYFSLSKNQCIFPFPYSLTFRKKIYMAEKATGFKREIKLFDAVMIVTGGMIGSGIFIVSADIARLVGSAGWLLFVWALAGFITIIAALSYGELSSMFPNVGGQYVYLREAYNKMVAFLYGWTLFLVIQTGVIAAVAMAFARFTGVFIPWFNEQNILYKCPRGEKR